MSVLLISDSDRDSLAACGLLLGTTEGVVSVRVVASLPEAARLLHDARRAFTRIVLCGVPPADSGSLRSSLTVLQARGTRVEWFDTHEYLWTSGVREVLSQLGVEFHLPDRYRPETERPSGLVLAGLLERQQDRALGAASPLREAVRLLRPADTAGLDWITLLDGVQHDHRLVTNRMIRGAVLRVWAPAEDLTEPERKLVALQRSRESRVARFLEQFGQTAPWGQELLTFDAEQYRELRFIRPRMYVESARRLLGARYAQARVERNWSFATRDPYSQGLDLPVAFLERLWDVDARVHGYPYRASVRIETGVDFDERLMKVLETALEEERTGKRSIPVVKAPDEYDDF